MLRQDGSVGAGSDLLQGRGWGPGGSSYLEWGLGAGHVVGVGPVALGAGADVALVWAWASGVGRTAVGEVSGEVLESGLSYARHYKVQMQVDLDQDQQRVGPGVLWARLGA